MPYIYQLTIYMKYHACTCTCTISDINESINFKCSDSTSLVDLRCIYIFDSTCLILRLGSGDRKISKFSKTESGWVTYPTNQDRCLTKCLPQL